MSTSPKHLGKYELLERLGQGGMAEVWKCLDPQLKRYVAIKFLHANLRSDPDFMNRFQREGQAIAALRHPNIVQVYDFQISSDEDDDGPMAYMVMDYIEGPTLADYIRRTSYAHNFPTNEEIVRLFTPISLAIDYAHRQRMIHRDIKPANILLDTRNTVHNPMGEPILTDFGIVKMLGTATITSTGTSMGTPLYISPEQVQGQPGNERSDIYSLGVMLYEICSGTPLYNGDTPYAIMAQHVTGQPVPPSQRRAHISSEVDAVILCCLAKDPQARFANAAAMIVALSAAFHLPVPEQIRRSISSFNLEAQPSSTSASNPELPLLETHPTNIQDDQGVSSGENGRAAVPAGKTVLSGPPPPAPTFVGDEQDKARPSGANHPYSPPGPVTPLPPSKLLGVLPVTPVSQAAAPPSPVRKNNRLFVIASVVLLIVLLVGIVGTYALFHNKSDVASSAPTIVGTAAFFSSNFNNHGTASINDGILVNLRNVPIPASGDRYYGWLRDNQDETASVYLGVLKVDHGTVTLPYTDAQHRDLLAQMSSFLVTEEIGSVIPANPSLYTKQWRYYATFPQRPSSVDGLNYLDHIRHLLSGEPALSKLHLSNGVDFWLLNNTQEMYKSVFEARDQGNVHDVRKLITDILYYLDGKCAQQELSGAPGGINMPENGTIADATRVSLLDCAQLPTPPGHITHVAVHLNGIVKAPGASEQQIQLAAQINSQLDPIRAWLQNMRKDALQLAQMDDTHLAQAHTFRNDLANQASYVIGGYVDPSTQVIQPGVEQICDEVSLLANFEVEPYKAP